MSGDELRPVSTLVRVVALRRLVDLRPDVEFLGACGLVDAAADLLASASIDVAVAMLGVVLGHEIAVEFVGDMVADHLLDPIGGAS